jgi:Flp pilus assembly secretin CpaC
MSATRARKQTGRISQHISRAALVAAAFFVAGTSGSAETLNVVLDRATVLKMPDKVATLIIGNPLIADVSLQPGGIMILTGKGFGVTNFLALDRAGTVLMERSIQVLGARDDVLVVHRGIQQESYSCAPTCERRITLGDAQPYFDAALGQTVTRNGTLQGQAQSK